MAVSEAVAVLPQASVQAVLEILALNARNLTAAEFVAAGIGTDPQQPFENFAFVGLSRELAEQIGRPSQARRSSRSGARPCRPGSRFTGAAGVSRLPRVPSGHDELPRRAHSTQRHRDWESLFGE